MSDFEIGDRVEFTVPRVVSGTVTRVHPNGKIDVDTSEHSRWVLHPSYPVKRIGLAEQPSTEQLEPVFENLEIDV